MNNIARTVLMRDGASIPQMGLGVMYVPEGTLPELMREAVNVGYRHFDTATVYGNEAEVGEGLRSLDIDRNDVFVTTKLPDGMHGYDQALRAFDASARAIGKIDLYLIHWPQPAKELYGDSWRALVRLQEEGRVRSIGVANFTPDLIERIAGETGVYPVINQVELHPRFQQRNVREYNGTKGILTQAWSPLEHGLVLTNEEIIDIAKSVKRSPAQVVLRWHLQSGLVVIPKAANTRHLADNFAAWDFELSHADMTRISSLDQNQSSFGLDPMTYESERGRIES
ncbi:aldo/keto reductase [Agrobacterium pusense]|uniref:aldo/keto reductase n=1 Tax=Agrobacterium pusense TaxID=648995 RepID=UPI00156ACE1D|nr:aldo/keto reductase [Agrobacterium pusense]QKJ94432.1 aldo/keto reductase [Agrobacterium pusense]